MPFTFQDFNSNFWDAITGGKNEIGDSTSKDDNFLERFGRNIDRSVALPGSFINNDQTWKKIAKGALSVVVGFPFAAISLIYTPFEHLFEKTIPEEREKQNKKDELIADKNTIEGKINAKMSEVNNEEVIKAQEDYKNQKKENNLSKEEMMDLRKSDSTYISEELAKKEQNHKGLEDKLTKAKEDYKTKYNNLKENIEKEVTNLTKEEKSVTNFKNQYNEYLNQYKDYGLFWTTTIKPIEINAPTKQFNDSFQEENENLNKLLSNIANQSMGLVH
jgi:hypothetical protein